jgi:actin-related protein 6
MNLPNVQAAYDEVVFEEFEFDAYTRTTAPSLCAFNDLNQLFHNTKSSKQPDVVMVVDCGFSFSHAVPVIQGRAFQAASRR